MNQLLAIGSMIILSMLALSFHRANLENEDALLFNRAVVNATTFSSSLFIEIERKSFDEKTVSKTAKHPDSLSSTLGPDVGETLSPSFDDIDDYNNFTRKISLPNLGLYSLVVRVSYINNPTVSVIGTAPVSNKSFSKKVDLLVAGYLIPDTLRMSKIISY